MKPKLLDSVQYQIVMNKIKKAEESQEKYLDRVYSLRPNVIRKLQKDNYSVQLRGTYDDEYYRIIL